MAVIRLADHLYFTIQQGLQIIVIGSIRRSRNIYSYGYAAGLIIKYLQSIAANIDGIDRRCVGDSFAMRHAAIYGSRNIQSSGLTVCQRGNSPFAGCRIISRSGGSANKGQIAIQHIGNYDASQILASIVSDSDRIGDRITGLDGSFVSKLGNRQVFPIHRWRGGKRFALDVDGGGFAIENLPRTIIVHQLNLQIVAGIFQMTANHIVCNIGFINRSRPVIHVAFLLHAVGGVCVSLQFAGDTMLFIRAADDFY